jgi:hypothetical protein
MKILVSDWIIVARTCLNTKLLCTGGLKKKLTCLIYFNLETKIAITPKLRALHSVLSNLNFDIRPVQFRAILTERASLKLA